MASAWSTMRLNRVLNSLMGDLLRFVGLGGRDSRSGSGRRKEVATLLSRSGLGHEPIVTQQGVTASRLNPVGGRHVPVKSGLRFSANAATPSWKSFECRKAAFHSAT